MLSPVMRLLTLHRILIATMILFLGYFGWYQARAWQASGSGVALGMTVGCALIAVALTWYLTNLKRYVHLDDSVKSGVPPASPPSEKPQ